MGLSVSNTRMMSASAAVIVLAMGLTDVSAQDMNDEGAQVFAPAFFDQFAPRTALQMVRQVPGFSIQSDNDGSRGFGAASGNVLINGKRISGKSNGATDALDRIPATNVERIELVDGASLDIPGLSGQVVNVIAKVDGVSGVYEWQARWRDDLPPFYNAVELSLTGQRGTLGWTLAFESDPGRSGNLGLETVRDGDGTLFEVREEEFVGISEGYTGSVALNWAPQNGHEANLNLQYWATSNDEREVSLRTPLDGRDPTQRTFTFSRDATFFEGGADYAFDLGPGRLKLIGLHVDNFYPTASETQNLALTGDPLRDSRFERDLTEQESILRGEYGWSPEEGRDWQVSLEGVYNLLESESAFFQSENGAPLQQETLSDPTTSVDEIRSEALVTHTRTISPQWTLQGAIGAEYSQIAEAGAQGQERSFTRPKGFISASYTPSDATTWALSLERSVGQLDFFDFVSSQDLDDDQSTAGNSQIVPQQSWDVGIQLERNYGALGGGFFRIYGSLIEDRIENIPLGPDAEGPGNVDSAYRYGLRTSQTFTLDAIGWTGVTLEFEADWRGSSVDDPLTGKPRRLSSDRIWLYQIEIRHDIPSTNWAWGGGVNVDRYAPSYRLDSISEFENAPGYGWLWVEHKDLWGLNARINVGNVLDSDNNYSQVFYEPRRTGDLVRTEDRSRNYGPIFRLRLSGNF